MCVNEAKLQLKPLYLFIFFSQGQRGRFRNRLNRTGQHGLAHFRDPRTNWVIDWYFALGGTNGPGPVGSYRHCLVQQTAAAVPWLQNIFFQPEIHSSFLLSQISKALLFVWDTTFEYCAQTLFFLKVGLRLNCTELWNMMWWSMFHQYCHYWCYSLELNSFHACIWHTERKWPWALDTTSW